jgi:predicted acyltransferase
MYSKIIWRSVKIFVVGILLALYVKINSTELGGAHIFWLILIFFLMAIFVLPDFRTKNQITYFAVLLLYFLALSTILALIIFKYSDLRIVGVLQRIALVFLVCAILFLTTNWKKQAIIAGIILVGYWIAMCLIPTPGYGQPMLEPGVNMAAWIDSYLVPGRLYQKTWDPEGFFSTFPAIASGITGMLAGTLLVSKKSMEQKIIWLFTAGFIAATAGVVWSWCFPLNKALWTSSFVLVTSGLASLTLATSLYLIDVLGYQKYAKPWVIFGSNAISVYVLAGLLGYLFYGGHFNGVSLKTLFMNLFTGMGLEPKFVSLVAALLYIGILFIPAWILYKKKFFIKL